MKKFQSVLVIDNDPVSNYAAKKFFNKIGKFDNLYFFKTGKEAIRFIELHFLPELILLDLDNPEVDGDEFMEQLKQKELFHDTNLITYASKSTGEIMDPHPRSIHKPLTYEKFCIAIGVTITGLEV